MNQIIVAIVSGLIIFLGLAGTLLPFLPGPPLSLLGLIIYGWYTHFQTISVTWLVIFAVLTALTVVFDVLAPALGAKGYKSSKYGVWGAIIGGLVGIFALGPLGGFIGPFVGGFIGEYLFFPDHDRAMKAAWGAFVGIVIGTVFKFAVTMAMLGYFVIALIRN